MPHTEEEAVISAFWYRLYPELRYFKSREEMRAVKRAFRREGPARGRAAWFTLLLMGFVGGACGYLSRRLWFYGLPYWLILLIVMVVGFVIGGFISMRWWHWPYIRFVRRYLQEHGIAVCLKCGYDLRGQSQPRCPECGTEFDPDLLYPAEDRSLIDPTPPEEE